MTKTTVSLFAAIALSGASLASAQQEDAGALTPAFKEGEVISLDQIEKLRPFLPKEFWDNRDFFCRRHSGAKGRNW